MRREREISSSSNLSLSQQRDQQLQYLKTREKLFTDTFKNISLKEMNLSDQEKVIEKERKRLGVADKKLTLEQLGFGAIQNSNNLFNLVKGKKVRIIDAKATMQQIIITIQTDHYVTVSLQSGTLLYPAQKESNQTLIVCNSISTCLKPGINPLSAKTLCYNLQMRPPYHEPYLLGSIRCIKHRTWMSQNQVWQITVKKKDQLEHYQGYLEKIEMQNKLEKQEKQERKQYIAITKTKIKEILQQWCYDQHYNNY